MSVRTRGTLSVGANRIGVNDGLAGRVAHSIFEEALKRRALCNSATPRMVKYRSSGFLKSESVRKKFAAERLSAYRPIVLDALGFDRYRRLDLLVLNFLEDVGGTGKKKLCVATLSCQLAEIENFGQFENTMLWCNVTKHAVRRLVQRNKARSVGDLMPILKMATGWIAIANLMQHQGSFVVPVEDGLFCCGMDGEVQDADTKKIKARLGSIRTFIGLDQMRPDTLNSWQKMVNFGGLKSTPRALALVKESTWLNSDIVDSNTRRLFKVMGYEGQKWDVRFNRWKTESNLASPYSSN
ncbi:hypothetical protein [Paracoccus sp. TOH]|uniref:hypothetical protein n=1 Tax=Paracoccus sp. TOH TaxID=1263728 RepID=UPI0025B0939D|nr:hypothetical protein [Paracoccus sp. TOH]WJS87201.1 hypothetical protein NBE95_20190 [Paracoccus sp. TOH]